MTEPQLTRDGLHAATPEGGAPHRLVTLGRLALLAPDGTTEPSLTTRRRKLALLAFLALHERPVPRAVLLGVFWGERDEERARASLNDALSHLRRVLGRDLVRTRSEELSLEPASRLAIDALELLAASRAGDHGRVVALYGGPFLDGVFVEGSNAFEDWSARERRRMEDAFAASCAARCAQFARERAWRDVEGVAERWLVARPASGDAALFLLNARKVPGTREALIAALDTYESLRRRLAQEYDATPERAVRELAASIRAACEGTPLPRAANSVADSAANSVATRVVVPPRAVPGAAAATPAPPISPSPPTTTVAPTVPMPAPTAPAPIAAWRAGGLARWMFAAAIATLVVAALAVGRGVRGGTRGERDTVATREPPRRALIAVIPVVAAADDSAAQWLAGAMPAMIASRLARAPEVEVLRPELLGAGSSTAGADVVAKGALRARTGDSAFALDLLVRDGAGKVLARHELFANDAVALADAAAARLLSAAGATHPGTSMGELETASVEAYQRVLEAERAAVAGDGEGELRGLNAALALDSGFASALVQRYRIAEIQGDSDVTARLRPHLQRARARASERDRLLLDATEAGQVGDNERAWLLVSALAERYPHDYLVLTDQFLFAYNSGRFDEAERIVGRQLALVADDATESPGVLCGTLARRSWLRRERDQLDAALADARRAVALCPQNGGALAELAVQATAAGRMREAWSTLANAREVAGQPFYGVEGRALVREGRWESVDSAIASWRRRGTTESRAAARDMEVIVAREHGQHQRAARLQEGWRKSDDFVLPVYLDDLLRSGRFADATRLRASLARHMHSLPSLYGDTVMFRGIAVRGWAWQSAIFAEAEARNGDTTVARALADSLARIGPRSNYARDARLHHQVQGALLARAGLHEAAVREFRAAYWLPAGWSMTNLELARSLIALGRASEALPLLRETYASNLEAMGRYATRTEVEAELSRAFAAMGVRDSATTYAARVRRAWRDADPEVRAQLATLPRP